MVYGQAGILPQAILDFNMAITINPSLAKAYNNRGNAYGQQGNLLQAISDFTRAIEIDPNFAEAYNNRGFSYYTAKEYDRSWTDVHKAERLGVKNLKFLQKLKEASNRVR